MSQRKVTGKSGRWWVVWVVCSVSWMLLVGLVNGLQPENRLAVSAQSTNSGTYEELQKLFFVDGAAGDNFGTAIDMDGEFAVVGAHNKTVNGNEREGAAYVYRRTAVDPEQWELVAELTADDETEYSFKYFGLAVAISGDYVAVGAPLGGVNSVFGSPGAVYLFARNEGGADNWGKIANLAADDTADGDLFGQSLTLEGRYLVVGAPGAGAAYVFYQQSPGSNTWEQVEKLTAEESVANSVFGISVDLSGDTLVVGDSLKGYVYQREFDTFTQTKILTVMNSVNFGESVAVMDDTLVVGATGERAAYVFERDAGGLENWGLSKKVTAGDETGNNAFGFTVSIWQDTVVVGAHFKDAAYVFSRHAGGIDNWGQVKKLTASDNDINGIESFGIGTAVQGETVMIGAMASTIGTNVSQGAAYVFRVVPSYAITVSKSGTGNGTITSNLLGIDCGITCTASFPIGEAVTLTAVPDPNSIFSGWSGACAGLEKCELTMTQTQQVTATFTLQSYDVAVSKSGTGADTISSSLPGIDCGITCTAAFAFGEVVTLTAVPDSNSIFSGWSGACASLNDCVLTITQTHQVTATFQKNFKEYLPFIVKE